MWFATVIFKNLFRRKTRTLLTVAGISIGVAAVVAMTAIAWGFEKGWVRAYTARGTDLAVTRISSKSPMPTAFPESVKDDLRQLPGVAASSGVLSDFMGIEESPGMIVFGWEQKEYLWDHLKLIDGHWPHPGKKELMLGTVSADLLGKKTGSKVQIDVSEFEVCGIFESPALVENGAVVMALPEMQKLTDNPAKVNFINLRLDPGMDETGIERMKAEIKSRFPGFSAFKASEMVGNNTGVKLAKAMGWATSLIALVVGAVGMMNTIFMSIFERIHEIGILLAIGWKRGRILRMILWESVALSVVGGFFGSLLGFVAVRLMEMTPIMRGRISGDMSPQLFGMAFLIALGLGFLGGLYPAWRGSRMPPCTALRHE
jgi:putative ABC transport system permease protein